MKDEKEKLEGEPPLNAVAFLTKCKTIALHCNAKCSAVWKVVFTFAFLFFAFQLIFVNREFSVADNGDFPRYMKYLDKPCSFAVNWPTATTDKPEYLRRFFEQPQMYWEFSSMEKAGRWPASAHFFWDIGKKLNQTFFNARIFSARYWGICYYLIQFFVLFSLYQSFRRHYKPLTALFLAAPVFVVLADAQVTAYYHSLYGESIVFSALTVFFGWGIWEIYIHSKEKSNEVPPWKHFLIGCVVFLFLLLAAFAKRQYMYLLAPTAFFWGGYLFFLQTGFSLKIKLLFFSLGVAVILISAFFRVSSNGPDMSENIKAHNVSHGLYYGILKYAKDPENLLTRLHLPSETKHMEKIRVMFVKLIPKLNLSTFLKAIQMDPAAWIKLYFCNAKELGNFQCFLGMIPYGNREYPPVVTRPFTTISGKMNGHAFLAGAVLMTILILLFRFCLSGRSLFTNRILVFLLLSITLADIAFSTFDGIYENRKHILLGSYCTLLIYVQFLVVLFYAACSLPGRWKWKAEKNVPPYSENPSR